MSIKVDIAWIEAKREELRAVLDGAQADLDALDRIEAMLLKESPSLAASEVLGVQPDEIRGLSVLDAAILIAERNDGVLQSTPARELMEIAEVIDPKRKAKSGILYNQLSNSERFESIGRGEYRLVLEERPEFSPDVLVPVSKWDPPGSEPISRFARAQ